MYSVRALAKLLACSFYWGGPDPRSSLPGVSPEGNGFNQNPCSLVESPSPSGAHRKRARQVGGLVFTLQLRSASGALDELTLGFHDQPVLALLDDDGLTWLVLPVQEAFGKW